MKICCIIPDPGIRSDFYNFAVKQMEQQTRVPDVILRIDHQKINDKIDLVSRIATGVEYAEQHKCDWAFIIEDDWYDSQYLERFLPFLDKTDFVGQSFTYYYHIINRTWMRQDHPGRSSLFTTGFRIAALNNFDFSKLNPEHKFLDIKLWEYARHKRKKFISAGAIGIKHGIGQCLGKGHSQVFKNRDPNFEWLKSHIDEEAFEFYQRVIEKETAKV